MQEFGDFANIDIEKLLKGMDDQIARLEKFQRGAGDCVGRAEDEDGLVTVEYDQTGLRELNLHPKAMRLASGELADLIKVVLAEAVADFQVKFTEMAGEAFGERGNPMKLATDPSSALNDIKNAEAAYDRAFTDVMGELDRIRRRLEI
ncbi:MULTISPECIES: YbaB/EbfC family DNA-binding protein [Nonomuraea]|uniref:YbaB/EbfC family DNA-binding protein n=2 Tax=Nonomuraea TaxID=83681 RepID=A0ABW1BQH3_9ACTN|nr:MULTISPECIES: YbaB/EbfC family DNA-binding protein [Nonomuraea]MDA0645310.1 YbaB/EbfC family DNA-binding protein [Nonomuraea ferruginea]TXK36018.1 YbaB/EbfC family DNA-binding protein [Nonomuraea sp. C10]